MNISIKEIQFPNKSKDFLLLPWKIYKDDKNWVPPLLLMEKDLLNPIKHPFFHHAEVKFFLAYKNNEPVGRIAAILNHNHNKIHGENTAFFGFFESINDHEVAKLLFDEVFNFAKSKNCNTVRGPVSYSTNEQCGLLVKGFDSPPAFMMTHNPPYYINLLEELNFKKAKDLLAWRIHQDNFNKRIIELSERFEKRNSVKIRPVNLKKFKEDLNIIKNIYNSAWEKNWGFIPMTDEEFNHVAKDFKLIIVPELVLIGEVDSKPVAFAMALPDINQMLAHLNGRLFPIGFIKMLFYKNKIHRARILTLGILKEYRMKGIDLLLYAKLFLNGTSRGYYEGEFSWILEDNMPMNEAIKSFGANCEKIYRIYEINI